MAERGEHRAAHRHLELKSRVSGTVVRTLTNGRSLKGEPMSKKLVAEFIGTAILVYVACGVATVTLGHWAPASGSAGGWGINAGIVVTALAFGLTLMALAYSIGSISGCHVNPAVTLGMVLSRRMDWMTGVFYAVAQFAGGILGAAGLWLTFSDSPWFSRTLDGLGADGYNQLSMTNISMGGAFLVETILTAIFVFVILSVTAKGAAPAVAGVAIGLTLVVVHLLGIPLTGTSVNPARSFGPALFTGGEHLHQVWLFLVAPLAGAILSAGLHTYFSLKEPAKDSVAT